MYVTSRMSAFQTFYLYFGIKVSLGNIYVLIRKFSYGIYSSCAADEQFTFILRIQIQENICIHKSIF